MKKIILYLFFIFCFNYINAQKIESFDTILIETQYKSFYNYNIKAPSFVIYKLYKGGGNISRKGITFKDKRGLPHFNYKNSKYDRGHLCPAEDFAYDKKLLKCTFYYYNTIPQTMKLNRGLWKTYENKIRKESKNDSLLIVCGGCDYNYSNYIPNKCFKLAYSLTTNKLIYCILIDNNNICKIEYNNPILISKFTYELLIEYFQ